MKKIKNKIIFEQINGIKQFLVQMPVLTTSKNSRKFIQIQVSRGVSTPHVGTPPSDSTWHTSLDDA